MVTADLLTEGDLLIFLQSGFKKLPVGSGLEPTTLDLSSQLGAYVSQSK